MIIDKKNITINASPSKLGFTTTGGGDWDVWDRYLCHNDEKLFHIGNVCGTCGFFFTQMKSDIIKSYTVDNLRNKLFQGIEKIDDILLNELSVLFPDGEYKALLMRIYPYTVNPQGKRDYFQYEQRALWNYDRENENKTDFKTYYRGRDLVVDNETKLFEFFIPLYEPNKLNQEQVKHYIENIRKGSEPTAIAISVLDVKEPADYDEEPEDNITRHWCFANYLLDGHHKIQAAALEQKPITLITFLSKDESWKVIEEFIRTYKREKLK